ncbi:hypothetical protein F5Y14DRAFT_453887 [Nemania sp. NC0429]|nr:hypothetical protein F5Y14DRAFT_453887 [Nemania sp. NC0429]
MDHETQQGVGQGDEQAPAGPGGALDLTRLSLAERVRLFREGQMPQLGRLRVLEPSAVVVPHIAGHPVGVIDRHQTGTHTGNDGSVAVAAAAGHQFVDAFHAIAQPGPGTRVVYTARMVPNSVLAMQTRMAANLQGRDPTRQLESSSNQVTGPDSQATSSGNQATSSRTRGGHVLPGNGRAGFAGRGGRAGFAGRGGHGGLAGRGGRGDRGGFASRSGHGGFAGRGDRGGFAGHRGRGGFAGRGGRGALGGHGDGRINRRHNGYYRGRHDARGGHGGGVNDRRVEEIDDVEMRLAARIAERRAQLEDDLLMLEYLARRRHGL